VLNCDPLVLLLTLEFGFVISWFNLIFVLLLLFAISFIENVMLVTFVIFSEKSSDDMFAVSVV